MKRQLVPALTALLAAVVVSLVAGRSPLRAAEKEDTAPAVVTLQGSVVDMHCYVTHDIHDADHTACANACIARGVPAGFLADDGTLYVLFGAKPQSVKDTVKDMADVRATLRGTLVVRGGVKGIQIESIQKASAASPSQGAK